MVLLLVLGFVLVLFAIGLVSMAFAGAESRDGVNRSLAYLEAMNAAPAELKEDVERPFDERVLKPLQKRMLKLGRRVSGADSAARIQRKLDYAGNPRDWSPDRVVSVKVLGAIVGLALGFTFAVLAGAGAPMLILVAVGGLAIGFYGPDFYLYQTAYNRAEQVSRELADAIDLLAISVEAGLGFDAACQQVARNTEGPLAEEFTRMLAEMQIGQARSDALRGMADRTTVPDLKGFVGAMVQADSFGIPIGQVLRVQSGEMRVKRRQRAETKAQQVPVKITVPLIFCILPCLFVAVMGPAALQIMDNIGGR